MRFQCPFFLYFTFFNNFEFFYQLVLFTNGWNFGSWILTKIHRVSNYLTLNKWYPIFDLVTDPKRPYLYFLSISSGTVSYASWLRLRYQMLELFKDISYLILSFLNFLRNVVIHIQRQNTFTDSISSQFHKPKAIVDCPTASNN